MNHRIATTLVLLATLIGVACVDMSSPKGPASISLIQLPSTYVVAGDVMRDSNGTATPLTIIAYDGSNQPVADVAPQFFVQDSVHFAHIDPTNIVVGDQVGIAHVIGQIGPLQTASVTIPVTYAPDHIVYSATTDSLHAPFVAGGDTLSSIGTLPLNTTVRAANDSAVQGFVVRYAIVSAPASIGTSPAVYLTDKAGHRGSADTTDITGTAAPRLAVNSIFLADSALQAGLKTDSVVINAFAKYKGLPLTGSPLRLVVYLNVVPVFK